MQRFWRSDSKKILIWETFHAWNVSQIVCFNYRLSFLLGPNLSRFLATSQTHLLNRKFSQISFIVYIYIYIGSKQWHGYKNKRCTLCCKAGLNGSVFNFIKVNKFVTKNDCETLQSFFTFFVVLAGSTNNRKTTSAWL